MPQLERLQLDNNQFEKLDPLKLPDSLKSVSMRGNNHDTILSIHHFSRDSTSFTIIFPYRQQDKVRLQRHLALAMESIGKKPDNRSRIGTGSLCPTGTVEGSNVDWTASWFLSKIKRFSDGRTATAHGRHERHNSIRPDGLHSVHRRDLCHYTVAGQHFQSRRLDHQLQKVR